MIQTFKDGQPLTEYTTSGIVWVPKLDPEYHLFLSRAYISIHIAYAHISHIFLPTHCACRQLKFLSLSIHANLKPIFPMMYLGRRDIF